MPSRVKDLPSLRRALRSHPQDSGTNMNGSSGICLGCGTFCEKDGLLAAQECKEDCTRVDSSVWFRFTPIS